MNSTVTYRLGRLTAVTLFDGTRRMASSPYLREVLCRRWRCRPVKDVRHLDTGFTDWKSADLQNVSERRKWHGVPEWRSRYRLLSLAKWKRWAIRELGFLKFYGYRCVKQHPGTANKS